MIRIYVDSFVGLAGECIELRDADYHHVINVTRHRVGDTIHIFNPRSGEWAARIESAHHKQGSNCVLLKPIKAPLEQIRSVHLAVGKIKPDTWGWLLEKATELGATHIHPLITEHTQHTQKWQAHKWQLLMKGAAQQCERLDVPSLGEPRYFQDFLKNLSHSTAWFAALERCDASHFNARQGDVGFIIGPEGGFSDYEKELLIKHPHVQAISLGEYILRSETAAIAALAKLL